MSCIANHKGTSPRIPIEVVCCSWDGHCRVPVLLAGLFAGLAENRSILAYPLAPSWLQESRQ